MSDDRVGSGTGSWTGTGLLIARGGHIYIAWTKWTSPDSEHKVTANGITPRYNIEEVSLTVRVFKGN